MVRASALLSLASSSRQPHPTRIRVSIFVNELGLGLRISRIRLELRVGTQNEVCSRIIFELQKKQVSNGVCDHGLGDDVQIRWANWHYIFCIPESTK